MVKHFMLLGLLFFSCSSVASASIVRIEGKTVARGHPTRLQCGVKIRTIELIKGHFEASRNTDLVKRWTLIFSFDQKIHRDHFFNYIKKPKRNRIGVEFQLGKISLKAWNEEWFEYAAIYVTLEEEDPLWKDLMKYLHTEIHLSQMILDKVNAFRDWNREWTQEDIEEYLDFEERSLKEYLMEYGNKGSLPY